MAGSDKHRGLRLDNVCLYEAQCEWVLIGFVPYENEYTYTNYSEHWPQKQICRAS
jgi:hypothetical protein